MLLRVWTVNATSPFPMSIIRTQDFHSLQVIPSTAWYSGYKLMHNWSPHMNAPLYRNSFSRRFIVENGSSNGLLNGLVEYSIYLNEIRAHPMIHVPCPSNPPNELWSNGAWSAHYGVHSEIYLNGLHQMDLHDNKNWQMAPWTVVEHVLHGHTHDWIRATFVGCDISANLCSGIHWTFVYPHHHLGMHQRLLDLNQRLNHYEH